MGKMKKVDGSTLIETLIAMVIIMIIFVIAVKIFNNVIGAGVSQRRLKINQQLEVFSKEAINCGCIQEKSVNIDSVAYNFESKEFRFSGLTELNITAIDHGKRLTNIKVLLKLKNVEE